MPTIKLNKERVLKLIGKKISDEELTQRIPYLGTDLEEVNLTEIVVEIFPNRPDLLSEEGFARALSSFLEINKGLKKYEAKKSNYKVVIEKEVSSIRPYTACAVIKNLELDEQKIEDLINIQEKLHITYGRNRKRCAIGIYPMEAIKFPIKYTALSPEKIKFVPLEKNKPMTAKEILEKHEKGKEYSHLLLGKEKYPVFIDSNKEILSMPPIINSEKTGKITTDTKDVFLECSGYEFHIVSKAVNMIVSAMTDMGGETYQVELNYPDKKINSPQLEPEEILVEKYYVEKYLGLILNNDELIKCLKKMGFDAEIQKTKIKVKIPPYRTDIIHSIDVVEDIAIGYGFDKIPINNKRAQTTSKESFKEKLKSKIKDILISHKFLETSTYALISLEKQKENPDKENDEEIVIIKNSISSEFNSLRKNMLISLLDVAELNKRYNYPQNYFEIGRVFKNNKNKDTGVEEKNILGIIMCSEYSGFTQAKQILDNILNSLNISYNLERNTNNYFIEGRTGNIIVQKENVGLIGELNPEIITKRGIIVPISYLELDFDKIEELIKEKI